ncbi:hypothetical protein ABG067_004850 [Albugo candida]
MKDASFYQLLADELATRQRILPCGSILCVPQSRSLLAYQKLNIHDLYNHVLIPSSSPSETDKIGHFETLNGHSIQVDGSTIRTAEGFKEERIVRILLSEEKTIFHQTITVLHLSCPLIGGISVPTDPDDMDEPTYQGYTAILRSYLENECVFKHLEHVVAKVKQFGLQDQAQARNGRPLVAYLRQEWEEAVRRLASNTTAKTSSAQDSSITFHPVTLPIEQVVESFLLKRTHSILFESLFQSMQAEGTIFTTSLRYLQFHTPHDLQIPKDYQCEQKEAVSCLKTLAGCRTPLEMLRVLRDTLQCINTSILNHLHHHYPSNLASYQLTTDDLLDQLLYVLIQLSRQTDYPAAKSPIPLPAILAYIDQYHFINSNATALGFALANFQVAVEFLSLRLHHIRHCNSCRLILSNSPKRRENLQCTQISFQAISQTQISHTQNQTFARSAKSQFQYEDHTDAESIPCTRTRVHFEPEIAEMSVGFRFFAVTSDIGHVYTWGDNIHGRLGYTLPMGHDRSQNAPKRVCGLLSQKHVRSIACGAYHTLASDVNGHVFSWGSHTRGQLGEPLLTQHSSTPIHVTALCGSYITQVISGEVHSMALSSKGDVFSWGCNRFWKLGRPTKDDMDASPTRIPTEWITQTLLETGDWQYETSTVRRVFAGKHHNIALTCNGSVFTWGNGKYGQLGQYSFMDVCTPKQVIALADTQWIHIVDAALSPKMSYFLARNGVLYQSGSSISDTFLCPKPMNFPSENGDIWRHGRNVVCNEYSVMVLSEDQRLGVCRLGHFDVIPSRVIRAASNGTHSLILTENA